MSCRPGTLPAARAGSEDLDAARASLEVVGVVLCGGRSRRMGYDKGATELAGRTLVERAAAVLSEVTDDVVLACGREPRYAVVGLPVVLDDPTLEGPVAGLVAALEATRAARVVVLACDMPRVDGRLLAALLERARTLDLDACMLASERGEEPLCGVYSRAVVGAVRAAQADGRLRVTGFRDFPRADGALPRTAAVAPVELGLADYREPARNLNTPQELEVERRRWSEEEP